MKASAGIISLLALCAALLLVRPASAAVSVTAGSEKEDRVITKIVKLLEGMMKKSKADGDAERELYAKYKCYCDTNEASKTGEIKDLTEQIAMFEGKLEETLASSGLLSKEVSKLDADMSANQEAQVEAQKLHDKEKGEFEAKELDLTTGIDQMKNALQVLAEVSADQTMQSAADHEQYMAGHSGSLLKLQDSVKQALVAASAFVGGRQARSVTAFLEAPFTGSYSAQSGEIVGILRNMRDTFIANRGEARRTWEASKDAHDKYMKTMKDEYDEMEATYRAKQGSLGTNDGGISTLRGQLEDAKGLKEDAEQFLASLLDMCDAKAKQYEKRVDLRVSEEAAISQAINILNSDDSFATFGATKSATTGPEAEAFIQERSIRRHRASALPQKRGELASAQSKAFLQQGKEAREEMSKAGTKSVLGKIAAMVKAGTPFDSVLAEIKKMLGLIVDERKADDEHKAWCVKERGDSNKAIDKKKEDIGTLSGEVNALTTEIEDPKIGLLVQIRDGEEVLRDCIADQEKETSERTAENLEYQKDVANLVQAQELVSSAMKVLNRYYDKIAEQEAASLLQAETAAVKGREDPAPPKTFDDTYKGQSEKGNNAIGMLKFLLENTQKEEKVAHDTELAAQHAFEDEMTRLKGIESNTQDSLSDLRLSLAEKQKSLLMKKKDLAATIKEKEALEAYLLDIKPGCDFIMENIVARNFNRQQETKALNNAVTLIKDTPAYKDAMLAKHIEGLGDCKDVCDAGEAMVECKACLAEVSVPGYCAGHPATEGC